jgi:hypothetical protein
VAVEWLVVGALVNFVPCGTATGPGAPVEESGEGGTISGVLQAGQLICTPEYSVVAEMLC